VEGGQSDVPGTVDITHARTPSHVRAEMLKSLDSDCSTETLKGFFDAHVTRISIAPVGIRSSHLAVAIDPIADMRGAESERLKAAIQPATSREQSLPHGLVPSRLSRRTVVIELPHPRATVATEES
jgi:hypothetical protein